MEKNSIFPVLTLFPLAMATNLILNYSLPASGYGRCWSFLSESKLHHKMQKVLIKFKLKKGNIMFNYSFVYLI